MAARNYITLTLPQWTTGSNNTELLQLKQTRNGSNISNAWANASVLLNDAQFGGAFALSANGQTLSLTSNYIALSTPSNIYQLRDTYVDPSTNNYTAYYFKLIVNPPAYTASSNTAGIL
jgi:hypothetical protein